MQSLFEYTYFIITAKMIFLGFTFSQEVDSNNEEWINPVTGKSFIINNSIGHILNEELPSILIQAGVSNEEFMAI